MALNLWKKTLLLVTLFLLVPLSSGIVEDFKAGTEPYHHLFHKENGLKILSMRKLLVDVMDYDDAGANPKHDPRRRPGKNL